MANLDIEAFLTQQFQPPVPLDGVGSSRAIRLGLAQEERPNPLINIFQAGVAGALNQLISFTRGTPIGQQAESLAKEQALADVTTHPLFLIGVGLLLVIVLSRAVGR